MCLLLIFSMGLTESSRELRAETGVYFCYGYYPLLIPGFHMALMLPHAYGGTGLPVCFPQLLFYPQLRSSLYACNSHSVSLHVLPLSLAVGSHYCQFMLTSPVCVQKVFSYPGSTQS